MIPTVEEVARWEKKWGSREPTLKDIADKLDNLEKAFKELADALDRRGEVIDDQSRKR